MKNYVKKYLLDILKIEEDYQNKQDEYLLRYNIRIFRKYLTQIETNKIDMIIMKLKMKKVFLIIL